LAGPLKGHIPLGPLLRRGGWRGGAHSKIDPHFEKPLTVAKHLRSTYRVFESSIQAGQCSRSMWGCHRQKHKLSVSVGHP